MPQVGSPNGFIAQLTSPSWFGSMVTAANGAIVSCPAMISPAVAALNCGSPPHARAAPGGGEDEVAGVRSACGPDEGPPPAAVRELRCGWRGRGQLAAAASCGATSCGATTAGRGRIGDCVRAGGSAACAAAEPAAPPRAPSAMAAQQAAIAAADASRLPGICSIIRPSRTHRIAPCPDTARYAGSQIGNPCRCRTIGRPRFARAAGGGAITAIIL